MGLRARAAATAAALALAACSEAAPARTTVPLPTTAATITTPPARVGLDAASAAALQAAVEEWVASSSSAGVTAAVLWPDGSMWEGAAGLADEASGMSMQPGDRMRIASVTKFFVATVVVLLAEEGALGLDDAVGPLLPGRGLDERITVRHLLGHQSGLWNYTIDLGLARPAEPLDPAEVVAAAVGHGQMFPPGSHFAYSNTNYQVLGLLIEAVTGRPAHEEIRRRVLEPLALGSTFMAGREPGQVDAGPYGRAAPSGDEVEAVGAWTDGGLVSSAADLARFTAAVLAGDLVEGRELMLTESRPGSEYGLGVMMVDLEGRQAWGHAGGMPGYLSGTFFFPGPGVSVAALSNDWRGGDLWGLIAELAGLAG